MDEYDASDRDILKNLDLAIIREIYDGENAHEAFENELERALETKNTYIVIEPTKLGEETARWISVGNGLHKTAVLTGFGSILSSLVWPDKIYISFPLSGISFFCTGLYAVSWQSDPCCKYQVETDPRNIEKMPLAALTSSSSPVVLVRKDDTRRIVLHTAITLLAVAFCAFRIYKSFKTA
ncbi:Transmembrane protein 11, mitochondrial [Araneus ventricosus]|uniref:Transmembrane protein 11, mitochondrial n=1 Tax=Araneus ventricosus TaxID=182803 RepID=A0A4Y2P3E8_ARAVE|nr:Transmembrane protein 11, mitochondrial [Araneus ventricosus]GBN41503.1 Transmembrane protein 11, mitochondrial [Araneus ventricosus]GBN46353.1 Transmembrane protein 11, mitochondrial [Araneus ventricosus]GBN46405.1 Transmembrane protein 11, mitochondrial [Araneus ventricosus]